MESAREKYEQIGRWLRETGAPSREWDRLTSLCRDADRLAEAKALLREASPEVWPFAPELAESIDAFLSGGGRND